MGRRLPLRSLTFALALALLVSAVVLVAYDTHGAEVTLAILAPPGVVLEVSMGVDPGGHLGLDGLGEHPPGPVPEDLGEHPASP